MFHFTLVATLLSSSFHPRMKASVHLPCSSNMKQYKFDLSHMRNMRQLRTIAQDSSNIHGTVQFKCIRSSSSCAKFLVLRLRSSKSFDGNLIVNLQKEKNKKRKRRGFRSTVRLKCFFFSICISCLYLQSLIATLYTILISQFVTSLISLAN